jgi:putative hydrolase of the HAD superfamily
MSPGSPGRDSAKAEDGGLGRHLSGAAAIVFDAGNTLLSINYGVIAAALGESGHAFGAAAVREAEWRARPLFDSRLEALRSTETVPAFRAYCDAIFERLGVSPGADADAAYERVRAHNAATNLWDAPIPNSREAVRDIARMGYAVGVISNSRGTIESHLRSLGLADDLLFVIDSGVVGVEKPDPRIFALATERLGMAPDRAVYVGDLYGVDVVGARRAGWRAVLIDPAEVWGEKDCPRVRDVAHLRDVLANRSPG